VQQVFPSTPCRLVEEKKDVQYLEKEKQNLLRQLEDLKNQKNQRRTTVNQLPKMSAKEDCILLREELQRMDEVEKRVASSANIMIKILK